MQNKQKCPSKAFVIIPLYKTNYIVERISEENLGVCVNLNSRGKILIKPVSCVVSTAVLDSPKCLWGAKYFSYRSTVSISFQEIIL